jgi:hypothetical protein
VHFQKQSIAQLSGLCDGTRYRVTVQRRQRSDRERPLLAVFCPSRHRFSGRLSDRPRADLTVFMRGACKF